MRHLTRKAFGLLASTLFADVALACTLTKIVPEHLRIEDTVAIDRYFWKESFDRYSIVVALQVSSIEIHKGYTLIHVMPFYTWKSDGLPVQHIFSVNESCDPSYQKGQNYIVFAERAGPLLSHVKVSSRPMRAGDVVSDGFAVKEYLSSLSVMEVKFTSGERPDPFQRSSQDP